ncbi:hypothetical protein, partial [Dietzia cinnamea]|uniref:hypothetical protein n=1 Tax=Dietzia cinnamea TaxID=321318 RepID=UPI001A9F203A
RYTRYTSAHPHHRRPACLSVHLAATNSAERRLNQELDARSLIDLLGYSPGIIAQHAARSRTPMSDYITLKQRHQQP